MCLLKLGHGFTFHLFSFFSDSRKTISNSKLANGNNQRGRTTCVPNGQADLTLNGIKAVAKSHKNRGAGSSKSEFKKRERKRETEIKIPWRKAQLIVQVYSREWMALHHVKSLAQIASFLALHMLSWQHLCHTAFHSSLVFSGLVRSVIATAFSLQTGGWTFSFI